jgi:hypothetical protein
VATPKPTSAHILHPGRQMEYLINQYEKAHPDENTAGIEPYKVALWAVSRGMWNRAPVPPEERLRRELARHLRGEYTLDPQGRSVRLHHAVIFIEQTADGPKRRSRWYRLNESPPPHIKASFSLRRRAALSDVKQLSLDLESYNDNNIFGESLAPMDFDFNKDLEEIRLPTTYPEDGPPDADEDGERV